MDREDFFKSAIGQTMPDELSLTLRRNPENTDERQTFSEEAYEALGYQMHDWIMARTIAYLDREGRAPAGMRVDLRIGWDAQPDDDQLEVQEWKPWFALTDQGEHPVTDVDGERRLSTFLEQRRAERSKS